MHRLLDTSRAMFFALTAIKLVCEIALLALIGQGVLHLLGGPRRETNFFYQLLKGVTHPFTWLTRRITPAKMSDRHVPFATLVLLAIAWVAVTVEKIRHCLSVAMVGCR